MKRNNKKTQSMLNFGFYHLIDSNLVNKNWDLSVYGNTTLFF